DASTCLHCQHLCQPSTCLSERSLLLRRTYPRPPGSAARGATAGQTRSDRLSHAKSPGEAFFFSSRRQHTRCYRDWSSDVCSSDLITHSHFHRKEPTKNQNDSSYCRGYRNVQDEVLGKMDGHYCQHDYRDYENVERVEPDSKVVKTETENYLSKIRTKHRSVVRKRLPYVNCQLSSDIEDQVISCVRLDYRDDAKNNSGDLENLVAELVTASEV